MSNVYQLPVRFRKPSPVIQHATPSLWLEFAEQEKHMMDKELQRAATQWNEFIDYVRQAENALKAYRNTLIRAKQHKDVYEGWKEVEARDANNTLAQAFQPDDWNVVQLVNETKECLKAIDLNKDN